MELRRRRNRNVPKRPKHFSVSSQFKNFPFLYDFKSFPFLHDSKIFRRFTIQKQQNIKIKTFSPSSRFQSSKTSKPKHFSADSKKTSKAAKLQKNFKNPSALRNKAKFFPLASFRKKMPTPIKTNIDSFILLKRKLRFSNHPKVLKKSKNDEENLSKRFQFSSKCNKTS